MSDTVKVGDVIALPVRTVGADGSIVWAGGRELAELRDPDIAAAIARAINDHDRMREALERIAEGEWDERLHGNGIANEFMQIAAAALQTSDAQQENANG